MNFDVLVIGGGHAGCEAAHAAARLGCSTALATLNPDRIGFLSCNPAMGGLAKGQLVKEIDALGGVMGRITDRAAIQYRRLNSSKGPAVRSSRAQCDKARYSNEMKSFLKQVPRLEFLPVEITEILVEGGRVAGAITAERTRIEAKTVVITSGTFLRAIMHTGSDQLEGGRLGDSSAKGLSQSLERMGFRLRRLKTGTPPRLHRESIDWTRVAPQDGDLNPLPFSFYHRPHPFPYLPQIQCFITYTNERTHEVIEQNFARSPLFTGIIQGVGPRYCPSIEDKVKRFRDKTRHQLFLEPEGLETPEIYVNGISTSLPRDVQDAFVRTIEGLENAVFMKHGYAVEYDSVDARQLKRTLESKEIPGLFFAGQVNGTSGYEEAGAQGLMAGINAALVVQERDSFTLGRHEGYIGVLVDDLVLNGVDEPYRMFTSRAEYRLLLREDNADLRLGEKAGKLGLLSPLEQERLQFKAQAIQEERERLESTFFFPVQTAEYFESRQWPLLKDRISASTLLRRPEVGWAELEALGLKRFEGSDSKELAFEIKEQVEIQIKYEGYIKRDLELLKTVNQYENLEIPHDIDYGVIPGLSNEIKGRLSDTKPETLGQAKRVPGVTPAAVANLMIFLKMSA